MENFRSALYYYKDGKEILSDLDNVTANPEKLRNLLHLALDEWFDHAQGTGFFYAGDPGVLIEHLETQAVLADGGTLSAVLEGEEDLPSSIQ